MMAHANLAGLGLIVTVLRICDAADGEFGVVWCSNRATCWLEFDAHNHPHDFLYPSVCYKIHNSVWCLATDPNNFTVNIDNFGKENCLQRTQRLFCSSLPIRTASAAIGLILWCARFWCRLPNRLQWYHSITEGNMNHVIEECFLFAYWKKYWL